MPFTLAHPAAVVPLWRVDRRLEPVALVVGSLMPDLPSMLALGVPRETTHTFDALFWFCLPTGVLALALARSIGLEALRGVLPPPLRYRLALRRAPLRGWKGNAMAVGCLWLGAATHVLWDAFTHATSPLVRGSEFLGSVLFNVGGTRLEVFNLLQHGGTIVGLLLIAHWARRWYTTAEPAPDAEPGPSEGTRVALLAGLALAPVAVGLGRALPHLWSDWSVRGFTIAASAAGFTYIAAVTYAMLLVCAAWWALRRMPKRVGE